MTLYCIVLYCIVSRHVTSQVLQCGWTCVSCYWQSSRVTGGIGGGGSDNEGGGTVKPLVVLLLQLFSACMDPEVPPQDALLSIQGPMEQHSSHHLFTLTWFRWVIGCYRDVARLMLVVTDEA